METKIKNIVSFIIILKIEVVRYKSNKHVQDLCAEISNSGEQN